MGRNTNRKKNQQKAKLRRLETRKNNLQAEMVELTAQRDGLVQQVQPQQQQQHQQPPGPLATGAGAPTNGAGVDPPVPGVLPGLGLAPLLPQQHGLLHVVALRRWF